MKIIAIIPARFESSRLPRKLLADINGQSILSRVYQQALLSQVFDDIIVATDHQYIIDHCNQNNIKATLTSKDHISGTDRVAEVAQKLDADIVINIQADEPFLEIECIQELVELMKEEHITIGTLYKKMKNESSFFDFNIVKLIKDTRQKILYFSRQAIPCQRDLPYREWFANADYFQHIGVYGFKKKTLLELVKLNPGSLEISEKLEQLRWLENGYSIYGREVESISFGIDTNEDLQKARAIYK